MATKHEAKQRVGLKSSIQGYGRWYYLKAKYYWANWLESKTARLSKVKLYALFLIFLLCSGGYCTFLLIEGFSKKDKKTISITTIKTVRTPIKTRGISRAIITENEFQRIKGFSMYLDSLKSDPTQKDTYDSILVTRPGLLDSIKMIENYYESNRKMKENEK